MQPQCKFTPIADVLKRLGLADQNTADKVDDSYKKQEQQLRHAKTTLQRAIVPDSSLAGKEVAPDRSRFTEECGGINPNLIQRQHLSKVSSPVVELTSRIDASRLRGRNFHPPEKQPKGTELARLKTRPANLLSARELSPFQMIISANQFGIEIQKYEQYFSAELSPASEDEMARCIDTIRTMLETHLAPDSIFKIVVQAAAGRINENDQERLRAAFGTHHQESFILVVNADGSDFFLAH